MTQFITARLIEQGQSLQTDLRNFAAQLSTASLAAIKAVNPKLAGSELGSEWPLTIDFIVERRLIDMVAPTHSFVGRVAMQEEPNIDIRPSTFMGHKIRNNILEEAYGPEQPQLDFTRDLIGWADTMSQEGWPLFVCLDVHDESPVEFDIFEGSEAAKQYIASLTDGSRLSEESRSEGSMPYIYLSDQVVVNDSRFASEVLSPLK